MKKTILSVVLAAALIITACCSFITMSASASDAVNFLTQTTPVSNDASGAKVVMNSQLNIQVLKPWIASTDVCYGAALDAVNPFGYTVADKAYVQLGITTDVPFRITILDGSTAQAKWISFGSEFFNVFGLTTAPEGNFLPAGSYTVCCYLSGYYEWNYKSQTAAAVTGLYVEGKNTGNIAINWLQLMFGAAGETYAGPAAPVIDPNPTAATTTVTGGSTTATGSETTGTTTTTTAPVRTETKLLPALASDWTSQDDETNNSKMVVSGMDGGTGFLFHPSNKGWPAAKHTYASPLALQSDGVIEYDFNAVGSWRVMIATGVDGAESTVDAEYIDLTSAIAKAAGKTVAAGTDAPAGTYTGSINMADLTIPQAAMAPGGVNVTGIKVFAVGDDITINKLIGVSGTGTTATGLTTTTTAKATTTTAKAPTTTKSSPKTGVESDVLLYTVIACAAAAVLFVSTKGFKKAEK